MRLMVLTQVLDLDDPILGFAHGWMAALAKHVDRLIVAPLKAGRFDLPDNVEVRSLGKERGGSTVDRLRSFRRVVGGACREGDVDAILAHMVPRYAVYAAPFRQAAGRPAVPLVHPQGGRLEPAHGRAADPAGLHRVGEVVPPAVQEEGGDRPRHRHRLVHATG